MTRRTLDSRPFRAKLPGSFGDHASGDRAWSFHLIDGPAIEEQPARSVRPNHRTLCGITSSAILWLGSNRATSQDSRDLDASPARRDERESHGERREQPDPEDYRIWTFAPFVRIGQLPSSGKRRRLSLSWYLAGLRRRIDASQHCGRSDLPWRADRCRSRDHEQRGAQVLIGMVARRRNRKRAPCHRRGTRSGADHPCRARGPYDADRLEGAFTTLLSFSDPAVSPHALINVPARTTRPDSPDPYPNFRMTLDSTIPYREAHR